MIALCKRHRGLIHTGHMVRTGVPDPSLMLHGTVAGDGTRALFARVAVATSYLERPGTVAIPGLLPDPSYRVDMVYPGPGGHALLQAAGPAWVGRRCRGDTGRFLAEAGLPMPILGPEHALLLELVAQ